MESQNEIESLKRQLQFYKSRSDLAIEGSDGGYWDWDIQNNTLYNAPHWFEVVGWSKESLPEGLARFKRVVHPDDKERVFGAIDAYLSHRSEHYRCEFSIICEDGSVRYLSDRGSAIFDDEGNAIRMAGFATDVTDEKLKGLMELRQSRHELERAHRNLEAIFQILPGQLFVKDKDFRYIEVNEAFLKVVGKSRDAVIGKTIEEIFSTAPDLAMRYREADEDLLQTGYQGYESQIQLPDGSRIDVLINKSILHDEQGAFNGIVGLVTDVSAIKDAERKMEQAFFKAEEANRSKSQFLANMSHEIRTPMNAIIGFSELLEKSGMGAKEYHYLQAIKGSSKTLLTLINDILDLSKIEAGKMNLNYQQVDIAEIINELRDVFSIEAERKGIALEVDVQEGLPQWLYFDEVRLRQILLNVINNALKFTKEGSVRIEVRFEHQLNEAIMLDIAVIDSGIGIEEHQQKRVFNLFEQQDGQSTREFGGTGLGLSISKNLVEMMGGEIRLISEWGKGTTFIIHFDGVAVEALRETEVYSDNGHAEFDAATILVVDDVSTNVLLVESLFDESRIKVLKARNGKEGIEAAKIHKPDLILMDVRMPIMDGFEATRIIKRDPQLRHIPIIALTASVVQKDRGYYIANGFDEFLEKPFEQEQFHKIMKTYLPHRRLQKQNMQYITLLDDAARQTRDVMLEYLGFDAMQHYEEVRHQNNFEAYAVWAQELRDTAQRLGHAYVASYATRILDAIEAFDIEILKREIEHYGALISTLKEAR